MVGGGWSTGLVSESSGMKMVEQFKKIEKFCPSVTLVTFQVLIAING